MSKVNKHKVPDNEELIQQIAELTEALQRERADVINIRRRHDEQMGGLKNMVKAQVVRDFLPAIDNLERALAHTPKDLEKNDYVKGVRGVVDQFEKTLQKIGVHKIKAAGQPFDPNLHEAVGMDGDGEGDQKVSEEVQSGYTLDKEILRPAMVKVSSQPGKKLDKGNHKD